MNLNKTLDYDDLGHPEVAPTVRSIRRWILLWFLGGNRLGVNGNVKRRLWLRRNKMWEYARGLALTKTSAPERRGAGPFTILDVGGAMTIPLFYLAGHGDKVVSLDIGKALVDETNAIARRKGLSIDARTTDLVKEEPSAAELGAPGGFDFVYSFCVIEHILPPGQHAVARRMGMLLKPGGTMALTFDYGENARSESPMYTLAHVTRLIDAVGLPLKGNREFDDDGRRYPLSRRRPDQPFTFGALFFEKPA